MAETAQPTLVYVLQILSHYGYSEKIPEYNSELQWALFYSTLTHEWHTNYLDSPIIESIIKNKEYWDTHTMKYLAKAKKMFFSKGSLVNRRRSDLSGVVLTTLLYERILEFLHNLAIIREEEIEDRYIDALRSIKFIDHMLLPQLRNDKQEVIQHLCVREDMESLNNIIRTKYISTEYLEKQIEITAAAINRKAPTPIHTSSGLIQIYDPINKTVTVTVTDKPEYSGVGDKNEKVYREGSFEEYYMANYMFKDPRVKAVILAGELDASEDIFYTEEDFYNDVDRNEMMNPPPIAEVNRLRTTDTYFIHS